MHNWKHLTPRYVIDRLRVMIDERRHRDYPWLVHSTVDILSSWLKPTDVGFEWGSGRSTLWFAERTAHLTSVEHDPVWADRVRGWLAEAGCESKVDYRLEVDADIVHKPEARYLRIIDESPDESIDFCLVDGWQRADCCLAALRKIKPGGLLVLDNAELYIPRERPSRAFHARSLEDSFPEPLPVWQAFYDQVRGWRCVWTTNGIGDTVLYVKQVF